MARTVADEKKNLRAILSGCRDAIAAECARARSHEIVSGECSRPISTGDARTVVLYAAIDNEVSTESILADALASRTHVFYPRYRSRRGIDTSAARVTALAELAPGAFGILEPPADAHSRAAGRFRESSGLCSRRRLRKMKASGWDAAGAIMIVSSRELGARSDHGGSRLFISAARSDSRTGFDRRLNFIVDRVRRSSRLRCATAAPRESRTKEVNPGGSLIWQSWDS